MAASGAVRLFFGLPVPEEARLRLARWQRTALAHPGVRLVETANLHVTLAFLGMRPAAELPLLAAALEDAARGLPRPSLAPRRYRETDHVGMLVLADEGDHAAELQRRLSAGLEALGVYRPEARPWLAHVTVVRFRRRPGLRPPLPELEPLAPAQAVLYRSVLGPGGARYEVEAAVELAHSGAQSRTPR